MSKSPPYFTTYVETEVEIDPDDLEKAGWVYQGEPPAGPEREDIADVLRRWHDQTHHGAWRFCGERPCLDIRDLFLRQPKGLPADKVRLP